MPSVLKKALTLITGSNQKTVPLRMPKKRPLKKMTERELLQMESEIGSQLFGPIPAGHRREFFCLDKSTWIWHEEWLDEQSKPQQATTRYEVHSDGVLKVQDGSRYKFIEGEELDNLVVATRMYFEQVMRGVYQLDPTTGQALA